VALFSVGKFRTALPDSGFFGQETEALCPLVVKIAPAGTPKLNPAAAVNRLGEVLGELFSLAEGGVSTRS